MSTRDTVRFVFEADLPREVSDELSGPGSIRTHGPASIAISALGHAGVVSWSRADRSPYRTSRQHHGESEPESLADIARSLAPVDDPIHRMTDEEAEDEAARWLDEGLIEGRGRGLLEGRFELLRAADRVTDDVPWQENAGATICEPDPGRVAKP